MSKTARMTDVQVLVVFFIAFVLLFSFLDKGEDRKFLEKRKGSKDREEGE